MGKPKATPKPKPKANPKAKPESKPTSKAKPLRKPKATPKPRRRRRQLEHHHTAEVRAEALSILATGDLTEEQLAESLAVSPRTLQRWKRRVATLGERRPLDASDRRDYERVKAALAQAEKRLAQLELQLAIQKKFRTFSQSHRR
jgi:outer membrane biosynthesis protein TonB